MPSKIVHLDGSIVFTMPIIDKETQTEGPALCFNDNKPPYQQTSAWASLQKYAFVRCPFAHICLHRRYHSLLQQSKQGQRMTTLRVHVIRLSKCLERLVEHLIVAVRKIYLG